LAGHGGAEIIIGISAGVIDEKINVEINLTNISPNS
jgi:hypothetical protein